MQLLDLTLPSPEENLALDEALLDLCEQGETAGVLRFWEPQSWFVVVGYANEVGREVNVTFCRAEGIPICRRCTGGGTVLQGPGCLNYTLVLPVAHATALESIHGTNGYVLRRHAEALSALLDQHVHMAGHTDLAIAGVKFSGNAQRRRRLAVLFHGSFLLDMDLEKVEQCLPFPSKEPDYRLGRAHLNFLMNLRVPPERVKLGLIQAWHADHPLTILPRADLDRLVQEKYGRSEWNLRRGLVT